MAIGSRRLAQVFLVVFVLLGLASCIPVDPGTKRPVPPGEDPPPAKKPNTASTPLPPAPKKPVSADMQRREVLIPQRGTSGQKREMYFRKFVAQKGVPALQPFRPQAQDPPTFTDNEIKSFASNHFTWVLDQDEAKKEAFWSYELTDSTDSAKDKKICSGNMVSVTWEPGIGISSSTKPPGYLKESDAPILFKAAGSVKKHGEDGTYIEQEANANFPAGTTKYPAGTINYSFGHPPSHFEQREIVRGTTDESKAAYEKGCVLKKKDANSQEDIPAERYPPCSQYSGRGSKSCTAVGETMGVRFVS